MKKSQVLLGSSIAWFLLASSSLAPSIARASDLMHSRPDDRLAFRPQPIQSRPARQKYTIGPRFHRSNHATAGTPMLRDRELSS